MFLFKWANTLYVHKPKCFPAHQRADAQPNLRLFFESALDNQWCPPYGLAHHTVAGAGASPSTAPPAASTSASTSQADEAESLKTKFEVDQSQPTTSIQLRLADGTR